MPCSCAMARPSGQSPSGRAFDASTDADSTALGCHNAPRSDTRCPAGGLKSIAGCAHPMPGVAVCCMSTGAPEAGARAPARGAANAFSTACSTAWCTSRLSRKRTSILVGCTFTSTRAGAISTYSA